MDYRLKRQVDFNRAFSKGKKAFSHSLSIVYIESEKLKVGITVGKKHGNAVTRNKIKRLIRSAYRPFLKRLKNYHIVIVPRKDYIATFDEFSKDLSYLFLKENLIYENNSFANNQIL